MTNVDHDRPAPFVDDDGTFISTQLFLPLPSLVRRFHTLLLNNSHDQRRLKTMTDLMTTADLNNDYDQRRLKTMTDLMTTADLNNDHDR